MGTINMLILSKYLKTGVVLYCMYIDQYKFVIPQYI